ncbi:MAG: ABC transporter ATP-binding protein [Comamonadaceae bacterium]|nr:MAG: ABC transporter ATP-binding protein [Comamonadaceae bacterium]
MRGISKSYGSVRANRGVSLTVMPGQIVGLLGENGSGKSTLMKVLFGMVRPDEGGIVYQGRELQTGSPREALQRGIAMIHQHFTLVDAMTVTENLLLGWAERTGAWLDQAGTAQRVREAAARYGLEVDPDARVEELALGEKQRVEILKAIMRGAHLLILDEPTSVLSPPEVARLLEFLRRFRHEGHSVVFITHKLGEVLEVADEIVVLRDGQVVGATAAAGATREGLARLMVGRELAAPPQRAACTAGAELLRVEGLVVCDETGAERLRGVSFGLRAGEVLALAGVDGNGQGQLADALAGLAPAASGRILLDGQDITRGDARARVTAGIAYIPADRAGTSLVQGMSIEDNLALRDFDRPPCSQGGRMDRPMVRQLALQRIRDFDIRAASPEVPARTLSGGNQQKVALARELSRRPRVVIAFQPTWGLDPGATRFVTESLLRLRDSGAAVLYISSELEEVLAVGDRIGVLSEGRIVELVDRADADIERIGLAMAGASLQEEPA